MTSLSNYARAAAVRLLLAAVTAAGLAAIAHASPARAGDPTVRTQVFNYTGGSQSFVVPPRVKAVAFNLLGGSAGLEAGGLGGRVSGVILTTPGETLTVTPGGSGSFITGAGGFNGGGPGGSGPSPGGGGGGASTISGPSGYIAVAGGGGGGSTLFGGAGGPGGALAGLPGSDGTPCGSSTSPALDDPLHEADLQSRGGGGGNSVLGGGAGGTSPRAGAGAAGGFLRGGTGGSGVDLEGGGGGGGGWYGGGGGGGGFRTVSTARTCRGGGGGGGSSFFQLPAVSAVAEPGVNLLPGLATFAWLDDGGPVPVRVEVTPAQVKNVGESVTVTAKVLDQDGKGMSSRSVTFERNGANPGRVTDLTDAAGVAVMTYTGTGGGGADVVTASANSIGTVRVSGAGTVAWAGAPSEQPPATVVFVPPVVQGPVGTNMALHFRVVDPAGTATAVSYCVRSATATVDGCTTTGTATISGGTGAFNVRPTTTTPMLRVTAHVSTVGVPTPEPLRMQADVTSAALAIGVAPPPTPPEVTTVVFDEPAATTTQGSPKAMRFTARKGTGSFSGTVWVRTGLPGLAVTAQPTPVPVTSGSGSINVTPTAAVPVVQVLAYADNPIGGQVGAQDPTEATGSAAVVGTTGVTPTSPGTVVAFTPPVGTGAAGGTVAMGLVARHLDGSAFQGTVQVSRTAPGSTPSYSTWVTTDAEGRATVTATPTATTPVQVLAYADRPGGGVGTPDTTEAAGAAVAVAASTPPPPHASGSVVVFTTPAGSPVPPGVSISKQFLARRHDGSPFTGKVRWGIMRAGGALTFPNEVNVTAADNGVGFVTVTSESGLIQVVAFADRPGVSGNFLFPDATEAPGTASIVSS